jgi:hypothetical protein
MADVMRWRSGETNPVSVAVESATVIEVGDLIYWDTDDAKPASSQADQLTESANQRLFAQRFLGVSMSRSRSGDTDPITVATSGLFEFIAPSASYQVGDLLGCDEASSGTALEDQTVAAVASEDLAIGKCVKTAASSTAVLVDIKSTVLMMPTGYGYYPVAAQQALSGAGAVNVTTFYTAVTSTGANALTLANGILRGQLKRIQLIVDGGDATLTPTSLSGGTTITFADAGDFALLIWSGSAWVPLQLGNDADGATAPVLA